MVDLQGHGSESQGAGEYTYTLAVAGLRGKRYVEPILYGGNLAYGEESKAPFYRMLSILVVVIASGLIGIWIIGQRKAFGLGQGQRINILDIPWVNRFVKSRWFQPVFQVLPEARIQIKKVTIGAKSSPSDVLINEIRAGGYDTAVIAKHPRTKAQGFIIGSTTVRLVREGVANLIAVRMPAEAEQNA